MKSEVFKMVCMRGTSGKSKWGWGCAGSIAQGFFNVYPMKEDLDRSLKELIELQSDSHTSRPKVCAVIFYNSDL